MTALLRADGVLVGKEIGTLELDASTLTWTSATPGGTSIRILTSDVKSTLLSKRASGLARLKVLLESGGDVILEFTAVSSDTEEPWTLRDTLRDMLHNLRTHTGAIAEPRTVASAPPDGQPVAQEAARTADGVGIIQPPPPRGDGASSSPAPAVCSTVVAPAQPSAATASRAPPRARSPAPAAPPTQGRDVWAEAEALRQKRQLILQRDPPLRRLYEELVVTGIVPEPDFWAQHAHDEARHALALQRDGPASRLPSADEAIDLRKKELKIKLTPALITQIFFDSPKVRELYERTVPHKWTEQEFWQRYFRHKHFHASQVRALPPPCRA